MGYRSEVRSLIYGPPDKVQAFWVKHKLLNNPALEGFGQDLSRYDVDSGDGVSVIDLWGDSWKWYEDYPDVAGWMAMLHEIDDELPGTEELNYEFARVGEDYNDVVFDTGGQGVEYWLGFRREIAADIPTKLKDETNGDDDQTTEG